MSKQHYNQYGGEQSDEDNTTSFTPNTKFKVDLKTLFSAVGGLAILVGSVVLMYEDVVSNQKEQSKTLLYIKTSMDKKVGKDEFNLYQLRFQVANPTLRFPPALDIKEQQNEGMLTSNSTSLSERVNVEYSKGSE